MADKGYQTMRGGVYDILNHKFLTRGHTFLKNDSDFAQIEKRKASAKVFVPSDWFLRWSGRPAAGAPLRSLLCNRKNLRTIRISFVLEQLYHAPLVLKPAKIQDLKKMARHHIPHPQRDFYLQMSGEGDGGRETEEEDDD
ncbi:hypothetical protein P5673_014213 [Acropora cervicornis]|uniref:Uncharacterized protein n=1 Tax=Acropora cervicornis TaxID=6130 RepID=A0AAD9QJR0_ACRCE|nr:hypothetical protein P5673_014213 [Acropora cervicornis]